MNNKPLQEQPAYIRVSEANDLAIKKHDSLVAEKEESLANLGLLTSSISMLDLSDPQAHRKAIKILQKQVEDLCKKVSHLLDEITIAEGVRHAAWATWKDMCVKEGALSDDYMNGNDFAYQDHDHLVENEILDLGEGV